MTLIVESLPLHIVGVEMELADTYRVQISVSGALDAKGAVVEIPEGTFAWEAIQTFGDLDTFGSIVPEGETGPAVSLYAGVGGAKGYVKATLTLLDESVMYGQTEEIIIGVTEAVSLVLSFGSQYPV